ncbi:MAG: AAA family ATPase [Candidatus Magnetomorum sp.]|nr:AAA family ATPase [Candidatus Magnetomorum sp.]
MKQIIFNKEPAFINRKNELELLDEWIHQRPEYILFMYGPKSSGKTTLLMKFIERYMNTKDYDIKHFNLREILIGNYKDFIQAFFEIDYSKSKEDVKAKREYNLKVFKLSKEIVKSLDNKSLDPFIVMKKELVKIIKKGRQPVIIIDELQALDNIYMNGQRELLKELFNFFVSLTKESHLCHVIISSSDGFFMNRIYKDSKLTKTSDFVEVDYLSKKDIIYWLKNLEKESSISAYKLSDRQILTLYTFFGGSMWEISLILGKLIKHAKNNKIADDDLMSVINKQISINIGKYNHYVGLNKQKYLLFKLILSVQTINIFFKEIHLISLISDKTYDDENLRNELTELVKQNFLSFNPTTDTYQLQGKSMFHALADYIKGFEKMEKFL